MSSTTKTIIFVLAILAWLAANGFIFVIMIAPTYLDHSRPSAIGMVEDFWDNKVLDATYEDHEFKVALNDFYESIGAPSRLHLSKFALYALALILGILTILSFAVLSDDEGGFFIRACRWSFWLVQVPVFLFGIHMCAQDFVVYDTEVVPELRPYIQEEFVDNWWGSEQEHFTQEMLDATTSHYTWWQVERFARSLSLFFIFDFLVAFLGLGAGLVFNETHANLVKSATAHFQRKVKITFDPEFSEPVAMVRTNDQVDLMQLGYEIKWKPYPVIAIARNVEQRLPLATFFQLMLGGAKEAAFGDLRTKLLERYKASFNGVGDAACLQLGSGMAASVRRQVTDDVRVLARQNAEVEATMEAARVLLQSSTEQAMDRLRQDIAAGVGEDLDSPGFRQEVLGRLGDQLFGNEGLLTNEQGEDIAYPAGTRFYVRNGERRVFVIEQHPQVRSILVGKDAVRHFTRHEANGSKRYNLAFPYIIFVICLVGDKLSGMNVYYRKKPINRLTDAIFLPNLPNITTGGGLCIGQDVRFTARDFRDYVDELTNHFWQSEFNTHLPDNYQRMAEHDERVNGICAWEENSAADPLFMLGVDWFTAGTNIKDIIGGFIGKGTFDKRAEFEQIAQALIEENGDNLHDNLRAYCEGVQVEGRYSQATARQLADHLAAVARSACKLVEEQVAVIAVGANNEMKAQLVQAAERAVGQVLAQEFEQLATEIPIENQVDGAELIGTIREQGGEQ